jgi:hypothetical protein
MYTLAISIWTELSFLLRSTYTFVKTGLEVDRGVFVLCKTPVSQRLNISDPTDVLKYLLKKGDAFWSLRWEVIMTSR